MSGIHKQEDQKFKVLNQSELEILSQKKKKIQTWWSMPIIPALRSQRQIDNSV